MNWAIGDPPYANCTECGQGGPEKLLDEQGRCPMCVMPTLVMSSNPLLYQQITANRIEDLFGGGDD